MKRKAVFGLVLMLSLTGVLMPFMIQTVKGQKVWYVYGGGGKDFTTIQAAINAASDGDGIYVFNGTYTESVEANKTVRLVGENPTNTIIQIPATPNPTYGVYITANNSLVSSFTIIESPPDPGQITYGIELISVEGCIVTNNTIQVDYCGIVAGWAKKATIMHNNLINCGNVGVMLKDSNESIVAANNISQCAAGIDFEDGSMGNTFTQNNITSCTIYGVAAYSSGNLIYHNNIIDNALQVDIFPGDVNTWNNDTAPESGGNYWSNYTGVDNDHDGLGDTPHVLDGLNQDNYPLINAVSTDLLTADINGDRRIDMKDIAALINAYNGAPFGPRWNPYTDLNADLRTNVRDIAMTVMNFNKHYP